jgi:hypothetical protein
MAGKFKSDTETPPDWPLCNQQKIEAAVDSVKKYYSDLIRHYDDPNFSERTDEHYERMLEGMRTLIDSWDWLHSHYHHFQKYHAADADAWGSGHYYLGTSCVECEFSRSQQRAVDENAELTRVGGTD